MRKFSSYGPIDIDLHYYVPRTALIEQALTHLLGENSGKSGHYITVWAPGSEVKPGLCSRFFYPPRTIPAIPPTMTQAALSRNRGAASRKNNAPRATPTIMLNWRSATT